MGTAATQTRAIRVKGAGPVSGQLSTRPFSKQPAFRHASPGLTFSFGALSLQRKLSVGATDDPLEREADQVAERVMRMPEPSTDGSSLRRKCATCEQEDGLRRKAEEIPSSQTAPPPIVYDALSAPGRPLDPGVRGFMEPRFGHDFGDVRVHTGALASRSAEAVQARAYTVGRDLTFRDGAYAPDTTAGRELLAHELTHVVQQGAARVRHLAAPRLIESNRADQQVQRDDADAGAPSQPARAVARDLTDQDEKTCSPLYLQKLCVFIEAGLNGDRSGVPSDEEMRGHNARCRNESGYPDTEPDVQISDAEKATLRSPKCERGNPEAARQRARDNRLAEILDRSTSFLLPGAGAELIAMLKDPIFQTSIALAITAYVLLWLVPEPFFSKIAAAATTLAILGTGLFTISTIVKLANLWSDLQNDAETALSQEQINAAAERFGQGLGAVGADLLVFLASLLVGGKLPTPKTVPPAGPALATAESLLTTPKPGGVLIEGPWGRGSVPSPAGDPPPTAWAFDEQGSPLKIEVAPAPKPAPAPQPAPAAGPAKGAAPSTGSPTKPVVPVVPGVSRGTDDQTPASNSMRHQIQRGDDKHYASLAAAAPASVGVTAAQLRNTMAQNFTQFMGIARGEQPLPREWTKGSVQWESAIWSAIGAQSKAITPIVASGGIDKAGDINALRKCFDPRSLAPTNCASDDVRLDVENKGHNLKS